MQVASCNKLSAARRLKQTVVSRPETREIVPKTSNESITEHSTNLTEYVMISCFHPTDSQMRRGRDLTIGSRKYTRASVMHFSKQLLPHLPLKSQHLQTSTTHLGSVLRKRPQSGPHAHNDTYGQDGVCHWLSIKHIVAVQWVLSPWFSH